MATRTIITIDEKKCSGCALCIPNCPEGALRVIDGKARLVSDLFCDGLGACLGYCPEGAITLSAREAEPYDERRVMENIIPQGANTIRAHLEHLDAHGQEKLLAEALAALREKGVAVPEWKTAGAAGAAAGTAAGAAGTAGTAGTAAGAAAGTAAGTAAGAAAGTAAGTAAGAAGQVQPARSTQPTLPAQPALTNWPIQLHLLSPMAPQLRGKDVLLSADCVAHAAADFHSRFLDGRALAIACPKLDDGREIYQEKITALVDHAQVSSLTVAMMEVPCCRGLLAIAQAALSKAHRKIPVKALIISIDGGRILSEQSL